MNKNEALQKCMKLCSTKEYAPQEILDKLALWEIPENDAMDIIENLESEKFIDPFRYARYYVNDKIKFNKWGRIKISLMLKQKQIPVEAVKEAFAHCNEELYLSILTEELRKKRKTVKDSDPFIIRGKLFQFAAGRGFETDLIYKMIDQILNAGK